MTAAAWCRQTLKNPRNTWSLPRTMSSGSPASSSVTYWPGSRTWSSRHAYCHVFANVVCSSSSRMRGSTYQEAGGVQASSSGSPGS